LAVSKERKEETLAAYTEWLKKSQAVILVEYTGAKMKDLDGIRAKIREAGGEHPVHRQRQGKQGLGGGAQAVADHRQRLAFSEIIAERAGEHLGDERRGLGDAFDDAHGEGACAQAGNHEHRQQTVYQLGGNVHKEADKAQHPDAARHGGKGFYRWP